ncbi:MAG: FKBP-type peptidyl-prolyl cis-trans isomerase [Erythrobacter sp.]
MTEVTRVPIQPIAKGSLTKLWIGVIIAILIGAGVAYAAMPKGVSVETLTAGTGPNPTVSDVVFLKYKGTSATTDEVFDESQDVPLPIPGIFPKGTPLPLGQMLPGFQEGVVQMQKGGTYKLFIPSEKAYGDEPADGAPAGDLIFDIEIYDFMSEDDFQAKVAEFQQLMQAQQGGEGGAPGGPAGAPPAGPPPGQ